MIDKFFIGLLFLFVILTPIIYIGGYRAGKTATEAKVVEKVVYVQKEAAKSTKECRIAATETKERVLNAEKKNDDCGFVLGFDVSKCLQ